MGAHRQTKLDVVEVFFNHTGALTVQRVCAESGHDKRTVKPALEQLGQAGWISSNGGDQHGLGPQAGVVLGVSVARESIQVVVAGLQTERLGEAVHKDAMIASSAPRTRNVVSPEKFPGVLAEVIGNALSEAKSTLPVRRCAIAWHTPIDREIGEPTLLEARTWNKFAKQGGSFTELARNAFLEAGIDPIPVSFINDADAELLGEVTWGVARGARDAVGIKICGGVGAAILVNGEIVTGAFDRAGEIGHLHISPRNLLSEDRRPPSGIVKLQDWAEVPDCSCGGSGHLEQYCSARAILDRLEPRLENSLRSDGERPSFQGYSARGEELAEYDDDPGVIYVVQETAVLMARALCAPVLMLNPECVVVSTFPHHEEFAKTVATNLNPIEQRPGIKEHQRPRILAGTPPKDGGKWMTALGAAASAIEHQRGHIRAAVETETR